jgi:glycogen debranching enzyme
LSATPHILIDTARIKAIELLRRNLTPHGIMAASPGELAEARRYTRVFGRDAAICALGMAVSGEADLEEGAVAGLHTLARYQAQNGQIPKFVDPVRHEADFWYLGCIDATLWWLIALNFLSRRLNRPELLDELRPQIDRALTWLSCQEHQRLHLLQQNEASDWADLMPRSGFVLYTNALWYEVKRRFALKGRKDTKYHFNHLFWPFSRHMPDYRRLRLLTHYVRKGARNRALYLSFVNLSFWGEEGDIFGNLLAILFGQADDGPTHRIANAIWQSRCDRPYPVRAVSEPIPADSPIWREYMGRYRQNLPFQYHNGGIWPFVGGFWVLVLAGLGKTRLAREELARLAMACELGDWAFYEWLHGETGEPHGMPGQSWNAAMFLLAHRGIEQRLFPLGDRRA